MHRGAESITAWVAAVVLRRLLGTVSGVRSRWSVRARESSGRRSLVKQLGWVLGMTLVVACGFPRPPDVGPEQGPGDGSGATDGTGGMATSCQLTAISPALAATDDVVTLEGTFTEPARVMFPGGTSVPATVLGPHRATTIVPATATTGDLTVSTCGATVGPAAFRRISFTAGLGEFETRGEQSNGGRQSAALVTARQGHASVVIGRQVYVVGGA